MKAAIIAISIIVVALVLYAIFAKTANTTSTGPGGTTEIHNGALGWLKGILNGLNLSVVGGG